jgi:uncharacterized membrane protein YkvA (DUF1232 family)
MNCGTVTVVIVICATLLFALFIVLLAMPNSRLRSAVLEILGWTVSAGSTVLLISPIDLIPLFPVIGQIDDVGYIITAIGGALLAYRQRQQRDLLNGPAESAPPE